jgi:phosphoribosylformimino-5-aminoimidazole carboxamide ribotide isomerase
MTLTLYPAIDLKDGACVRLQRGEMDQATVFERSPGAQAAHWESVGFLHLHVVDLNGTKTPVQLGGGIRSMAGIEAWLSEGVSRVILGSVAAKNPALVREAAQKFPGRIVVGIDARGGMVATEGWAETSDIAAADLAARLEDSGVAAIIYTDIARDGMKTGLNLDETEALAARVKLPVIASGGVASLNDILRLRAAAARVPNLAGTIIGRALYDGSLDAAAALAAC